MSPSPPVVAPPWDVFSLSFPLNGLFLTFLQNQASSSRRSQHPEEGAKPIGSSHRKTFFQHLIWRGRPESFAFRMHFKSGGILLLKPVLWCWWSELYIPWYRQDKVSFLSVYQISIPLQAAGTKKESFSLSPRSLILFQTNSVHPFWR